MLPTRLRHALHRALPGVPLWRVALGAAAFFAAAGLVLWAALAAVPAGVLGTPATVLYVVDGDTIAVDVAGVEERVRVLGIDTRELNLHKDTKAECGAVTATQRSASLMPAGSVITLYTAPLSDNRDVYGRLLRDVELPDGQPLGATLVREGMAMVYTRYPYHDMGNYLRLQAAAQGRGAGIWGSIDCEAEPTKEDFLAARGEHAIAALGYESVDTALCRIKGNITSGNKRYYYMPTHPNYARVKIDEAAGESYFCTEADAVAAGFAPMGIPQ